MIALLGHILLWLVLWHLFRGHGIFGVVIVVALLSALSHLSYRRRRRGRGRRNF